MAWGILILFGGGLCLAQGLSNAGIIQAVGAKIAEQSPSAQWLLFGLITASVFITELMSNVALVQIFLPVVFGIATNMGVNPILLGMPVTIGASTFALNVASTATVAVGSTSFNVAYDPATGFAITNAAGAAVPMNQADLDSLVRGMTYANTSEDPTLMCLKKYLNIFFPNQIMTHRHFVR